MHTILLWLASGLALPHIASLFRVKSLETDKKYLGKSVPAVYLQNLAKGAALREQREAHVAVLSTDLPADTRL